MFTLAQQQVDGGAFAAFGLLLVIYLAVIVLIVASMWKIFTKAGEDGWKAIIPIYNIVVMLQIIGRPVWWLVLLIIPIVNFIVGIIVAIDLAKSFGKGGGFAAGLILLPFIFYPMLGFGSAQYVGPAGPEPRPGWGGAQGAQPGYGQPGVPPTGY